MHFIAIDVETANADMASICQIGLVEYHSGILVKEWKTYVDPEDYFDGVNVAIHGIDAAAVKGAPTFADLRETLSSQLATAVVVCHTHFDRVALNQTYRRYSLRAPEIKWLDSARVARRAWTQCSQRGYGLRDVCQMIGYHFQHHDALEDAKAAAHIILSAISETGIALEQWLARANQPIHPSDSITRERNPEGPLCGEVLVFTGSLEMPRRQAADVAAAVGCEVAAGVTKNTTILVVGNQDVQKLNGHERSSKQRKAEELIAKGYPIRILREDDFRELVRVSNVA